MADPHNIAACTRCGKPFVCFMVRDEVWREAGFSRYGEARICMRCFEEKLGRFVTLSDLPVPYESYCNRYWHERLQGCA